MASAIQFASGAQGAASNDTSLASATVISFLVHIQGDKIVNLDGTLDPLFQIHNGTTNKLQAALVKSGANLEIQVDGGGIGYLQCTTSTATASFSSSAWYTIYVHWDPNDASTHYIECQVYDSTNSIVASAFRNNSYLNDGSFPLTTTAGYGQLLFNQSLVGGATAGTYDWFAVHTAALSGSARYTKPSAGATRVLYDMEEGSGTSCANTGAGTQALTLSGSTSWVAGDGGGGGGGSAVPVFMHHYRRRRAA